MLKIILLILFVVVSIESRQNLRDYVVSPNSYSGSRRDELSVYDQSEKNLLCRFQSTNNIFHLISYPSRQRIASIQNLWLPFLYQSYTMNILDDHTNKWMSGQIYQHYRPQGFRFTIQYGGRYYTMENKFLSLITEIRDDKRPNYVLTHFYQTNINPIYGTSKYNLKIYTDDLPDPVYILALYALDSNLVRRRMQFTP